MSQERGTKYKITARYFNASGFAVAIVASITHGIDWAVHIGATHGYMHGPLLEDETAQYVAKHGCKMQEKDARYYFPELKNLSYRH